MMRKVAARSWPVTKQGECFDPSEILGDGHLEAKLIQQAISSPPQTLNEHRALFRSCIHIAMYVQERTDVRLSCMEITIYI